MSERPFDVFLSYNSEDASLAQQIANELKEAGLKVWFDKWELRPGLTWLEGLDKGIKESSSTAVLVGPSGIGPWEIVEVRRALQEHVKRCCPVIPVILPGVETLPELPSFLDQHTWVDCRIQQTSQKNLEMLLWGITGRRPRRSLSQIGDEFFVKLQRPDKTGRVVKIYTIPNPDKDKLLDVTWETFRMGIENLRDQIRNYGHHLDVDACIGINDAGLVMATFLNSSVMGRVKIGYIKCEGAVEGTMISDDSFFPELPQEPTIMLMDFEVKVSNISKIIIDRIREEYDRPKIYFAVFGALTNKSDLKIASFDELVSAENLSKLNIKDFFIACTMSLPGIEPPLGLR